MDASLQLLKPRRVAFGIERDDLAVEDESPRRLALTRPRLERGGDLRELMRLFVPETRPQAYMSHGVDLDDRANTVVLRLVDQLGIDQGGVG